MDQLSGTRHDDIFSLVSLRHLVVATLHIFTEGSPR